VKINRTQVLGALLLGLLVFLFLVYRFRAFLK